MTETTEALRAASAFATVGPPESAEPLGHGHIHRTFSVRCIGPDGPVRYVLQRLNERVFPDLEAVIENAALLTRTLADAEPATDAERRVLRCIGTRAGDLAFTDADGGVWRSFLQIEGVRTYERMESPALARHAARAFAAFTERLGPLDPGRLRVPLPGFHDFEARIAAFERAAEGDAAGRIRDCASDVEALRATVAALRDVLPRDYAAGLPVRIVHNDCKLDNVLFDAQSGEALCVIDLDTTMPGTPVHDFGGLVRTGTCPEPEDSTRFDRIRVDEALYTALAEGYLEGAAALLEPREIELLPVGGPLITLEDGVRFLTDHLEGDVYYRITREGHNLDRARNQITLARALLADLPAAAERIERARRS